NVLSKRFSVEFFFSSKMAVYFFFAETMNIQSTEDRKCSEPMFTHHVTCNTFGINIIIGRDNIAQASGIKHRPRSEDASFWIAKFIFSNIYHGIQWIGD